MDSPFRSEILTAIAAIQQAAALSKAVRSVSDKGIISKEDLSPVTIADFAIQALLTTTIHNAFPSDKFVGEESSAALKENQALLGRVWDVLQLVPKDDSSPCRVPESKEQMCDIIDWGGEGVPGSGRVWVFDPIDGTQPFSNGEMYAINIGLLKDGVQMIGVVALPLLPLDAVGPVTDQTIDPTGRGTILFAAKGYGTHARPLLGPVDEPAKKLEPYALSMTNAGKLVSTSASLSSGVEAIHKAATERLGVAFPGNHLFAWVPRWASLALGLGNMTAWVYYKRTRHAKIVDHAGACLLFEEVGGRITDVDGKELDWSAGRDMVGNHGFVAAPRELHALVLKAVQEAARELGYEGLLSV